MYSHTKIYNTYIYKWCSLNFFRYFEFIVLQKKNKLCTKRRHRTLLIIKHIYHLINYYISIESFKE